MLFSRTEVCFSQAGVRRRVQRCTGLGGPCSQLHTIADITPVKKGGSRQPFTNQSQMLNRATSLLLNMILTLS